MNCQLCKYRTQIVGYEAQVGMRQEGHHHHVRGGEHPHGDHHHSHD
jgi:sirohydrochlorin cobaltochelatase